MYCFDNKSETTSSELPSNFGHQMIECVLKLLKNTVYLNEMEWHD